MEKTNNRLFKKLKEPFFGPIETVIIEEEMPSQCPKCNSSNVRRKDKTKYRKSILHINDGKLKRIIFERNRCECRDCKATFFPYFPNIFDNSVFTEEAAEQITKRILEHPEISVNKAAKNIAKETGISSPSAVDRMVKKRIDDLSKVIRTMPCYKLFFIPFKYRKITGCCAVVGLNTTEKKLYLLDILKDCSEVELNNLYNKTDYFKDKPAKKSQ